MRHHEAVRFRGITFDLDGTLADTIPVCYEAFRRVYKRYLGRYFTNEEIHATFGPCEQGAIQKLIGDWQPALQMYLDEYEELHGECQAPFPGILELTGTLRAEGVRLAVVTGKGMGSAEISLRRIGLETTFEIVEAGDPAGPVKPAAIRRVLSAWDLDPADCAHVGDAPSDVEAAREAGVFAIAAAWSSSARADLLLAKSPDAICRQVSELEALVA